MYSLQSWHSHCWQFIHSCTFSCVQVWSAMWGGVRSPGSSQWDIHGACCLLSDGNNLSLESLGPRQHWVLEHCAAWPPNGEHLFFCSQRYLLKAVQWSWEVIVYFKLRVVSWNTRDCIWIHRSIWWLTCLSLFISMEKDLCLSVCICLLIRKETN